MLLEEQDEELYIPTSDGRSAIVLRGPDGDDDFLISYHATVPDTTVAFGVTEPEITALRFYVHHTALKALLDKLSLTAIATGVARGGKDWLSEQMLLMSGPSGLSRAERGGRNKQQRRELERTQAEDLVVRVLKQRLLDADQQRFLEREVE